MQQRVFRLPLSLTMAALGWLVVGSIAASAAPSPQPFDDDSFQPSSVSFGGADPLETTRTVEHWAGQTTNPLDGVTYRYNMVGVDPSTDGSTTVGVDIIPLDVTVGDLTFSGSDSVPGVLASPLFHNFNYSSAMFGTIRDPATGVCCVRRWTGSPIRISSGNTGQLVDVTMRSQFNKVGSDYHLYLDTPTVYDPVAISVPGNHGTVLTSPVGVQAADVDLGWFQTRVHNLMGKLHLDPTRLAIFLTTDVVLFRGNDPMNCCVLGGHGAGSATGNGNGSVSGNGNQPVQTFVWSSWLTPGFTGPRAWINKDISGLSHEITEWAVDPFNNNTAQSWSVPNAPQYGCSDELETGDPTINTGFSVGTPGANVYDQNPFPQFPRNPFSDGMFHVQDEVLLPWFMRLPDDNTSSQPTQSGLGGRYTLMGDQNPLPWFHAPAATC